MATVYIEWGKFFMKNGAEVVDTKPITESDSAFEVIDVSESADAYSQPAPQGATVAVVTARNGDVVARIGEPIGADAMGRLCMDGGPRVISVKANEVLTLRARPAYV